MDKLTIHTPDLTERNIDAIADLFPTVVTEGRDNEGNPVRAIDFDLLRQELSDHVVEGPQERYQLDWPGKRDALVAANAPIAKTLRPVREESVDFDTTKNLFIEGDNLETLKLLQEAYLGKVDLIYIDPPYNTGNDLIYQDDFASTAGEYLARSRQADAQGRRLVANTSANGRFHSDWLSMMYPRLRLARDVLAPTGIIFISIGDEEVSQLRLLCDEVFGPENFVALLTVEMSTTQGMKVRAAQNGAIVKNSEFVLIYARGRGHLAVPKTPLYDSVSGWPGNFTTWLNDDLTFEPLARALNRKPELVAEARRFTDASEVRTQDLSVLLACSEAFRSFVEANLSRIAASDKGLWPKELPEPEWREGQAYEATTSERSYIVMKSSKGTLRQFLRLSDNYRMSDDYSRRYGRTVIRGDLWKGFYSDMAHVSLEGDTAFENGKKPVRLLQNLFRWANNSPDALVLDFFAGSATTGHAVMQMNVEDGGKRRFVLVQHPEAVEPGSGPAEAGVRTISELARERLRRSGREIAQRAGLAATDVDLGFRALSLGATNFLDVLRLPDAVVQEQLDVDADNVRSDCAGEALLFEVLLNWGLDLSLPVAAEQIDGREVSVVDNGALIACLDAQLSPAIIREIAGRGPLRAVFRDSAFTSDSERINAEQVFAELSPDTQVKVI